MRSFSEGLFERSVKIRNVVITAFEAYSFDGFIGILNKHRGEGKFSLIHIIGKRFPRNFSESLRNVFF